MAIEFTSKDFFIANNTDVWLATLTAAQTVPTSATLTTTANATTGATTVAVNATTVKYYDGARFLFGAVPVQLNADAAIGATSLTVNPITANISTGATATALPLIPLYSCRTVNTARDGETISARNFKSGGWASQSVVSRSFNMPFSGTVVKGDPAYAILTAAGNATGLGARLYIEVREPDGTGESGVVYVQNLERTREADAYIELSGTFLGDSKVTDIVAV